MEVAGKGKLKTPRPLYGVIGCTGHVGDLEVTRVYINCPHDDNPELGQVYRQTEDWLGATVEIRFIRGRKK